MIQLIEYTNSYVIYIFLLLYLIKLIFEFESI